MQKSPSTPSGAEDNYGESIPLISQMQVWKAGVNVFRLANLAKLLQYRTLEVRFGTHADHFQSAIGVIGRSELAVPDWLKNARPTHTFQYAALGIRLERWLHQMTGMSLREIEAQRPAYQ